MLESDAFGPDNGGPDRVFLTPGPAALPNSAKHFIDSCFSRGDEHWYEIKKFVYQSLAEISGHESIVGLQGSATLALEIAVSNFCYGDVLILESGFYSSRMGAIVRKARAAWGQIRKIDVIHWQDLDSISNHYDWILTPYVETSLGLKLPLNQIKQRASVTTSKLLVDATGSIGLENNHDFADVAIFSSCKGLMGITGASFIAFNEGPTVQVESFYLDFRTHVEEAVTAPCHQVLSLYGTLQDRDRLLELVFASKAVLMDKANAFLCYPERLQPKLCTSLNTNVRFQGPDVVLYKPRVKFCEAIICHLGELQASSSAQVGQLFREMVFDG